MVTSSPGVRLTGDQENCRAQVNSKHGQLEDCMQYVSHGKILRQEQSAPGQKNITKPHFNKLISAIHQSIQFSGVFSIQGYSIIDV